MLAVHQSIAWTVKLKSQHFDCTAIVGYKEAAVGHALDMAVHCTCCVEAADMQCTRS